MQFKHSLGSSVKAYNTYWTHHHNKSTWFFPKQTSHLDFCGIIKFPVLTSAHFQRGIGTISLGLLGEAKGCQRTVLKLVKGSRDTLEHIIFLDFHWGQKSIFKRCIQTLQGPSFFNVSALCGVTNSQIIKKEIKILMK